jgi:arsenite methyltransferase
MTAPEVSTPPPTPSSSLLADYGLDAPGFQLTARYGGALAVVVGRMLIEHGVMNATDWADRVGTPVMWTGVGFFATSAVMYLGSKFGKLLLRNAILNSIPWRGDEQVLDVGCGHGLMLLGAANRLASGHAVGIDVWSQKDQKDNNADATLENARREGVVERIEVRDADARQLPFPENSFDVVLSSFAIHNISGSSEREAAIREIARVLKPGGRLAIADIFFTGKYQKILGDLGWQETRRSRPNFLFVTPTRVLWAVKPATHA